MGDREGRKTYTLGFCGTRILRTGVGADTRTELTLPARSAGGLNADLDQNIFCGSFLAAVVGRDGQFILVLLPVV